VTGVTANSVCLNYLVQIIIITNQMLNSYLYSRIFTSNMLFVIVFSIVESTADVDHIKVSWEVVTLLIQDEWSVSVKTPNQSSPLTQAL